VANQPDIKFITPTIVTSLGSTVTPASGETISYTIESKLPKLYTFKVQAADPTVSRNWTLKVIVANYSHDAEILKFSLPTELKDSINTAYGSVTIKVKGGTNLKNINPNIQLSLGAKSKPRIDTLYSFVPNVPFNFTVYPQDTAYLPKKWTVTVKVLYDNNIVKFGIPGSSEIAVIDSVKKMVTLEVDTTVNLNQIIPNIEISGGCTLFPSQTQKVSFIPNIPFTYNVIGDSSSFSNWKILILRKVQALYEEEFDLLKGPQDWQTTAKLGSAGWVVKDQPRVPFSQIYYKSISSALHAWSLNSSNDSLISPIYHLEKYNNVSVRFYAGFSKTWLDSATLKFYIFKLQDKNPVLKWEAKQDTAKATNWNWHYVQLKIPELAQSAFKLMWLYTGRNGDLVGIDRVLILGDNAKASPIDGALSEDGNITLYPNPANTFFNITGAESATLKIYTLYGTLLQQSQIASNDQVFFTDQIPDGIYVVEIIKNSNKKKFKLIISK
jgi:hypothetical protein